MNLIHDLWIPVRRQSGITDLIRPAQIVEAADPPLALASPRADFDGSLAQFLIGLLQTCMPPKDGDEWEDRLERPPTVGELDRIFSPYAHAFEVDGDGPRFMQDFEAFERLEVSRRKPAMSDIDALLIDAPGAQTLRNNADHFIKRGQVQALCPVCAVTALFTLQLNAPSGGAGHRTSLRGGGPLTTLVIPDPEGGGLPDTLWNRVWLNILPRTVRLAGNAALEGLEYIFPWLAATRTSEKEGGLDTTPQDAHPYQMYWAMPRRIRLDFEYTGEGGCDLCARESHKLIRRYFTLNYGINYVGAWRHPLSPYQENDGEPVPLHPQAGGITYRHWLGLVYDKDDGKQRVSPATVVKEFRQNRRLEGEQLRLWAFGYDMDNMKPRCWYEAVIPLYQIPASIREIFSRRVEQLVTAAETVAGYLKTQVKKAWFKRPGDAKGDVGFLADAFFQATEEDFYATLKRLADTLPSDDEPVRRDWHVILRRSALSLFDEYAAAGDITFADPARLARARNDLEKKLKNSKLRGILALSTAKENAA